MALYYRTVTSFLIALLLHFTRPAVGKLDVAHVVEDTVDDGLGLIKRMATKAGDRYQALSPQHQLIASGLTGFVVTRIVVSSAIKTIKIGAALYIASEVLHYAGAFDNLNLSETDTNALNVVKEKLMQQASNYRQQVHRRLNPGTIQTFVQKERNAAIGLAGGAFIGFIL